MLCCGRRKSHSDMDTLQDLQISDSEVENVPAPPAILALQILQNELILPKILSYLPFESLKMAREVNTSWKEKSERFFKPLALITIDNEEIRVPELVNFLKALENFMHYKIFFNSFSDDANANEVEDRAFKKNIVQYLAARQASVKSLTLDLTLNNSTDFDFVARVLKRVPKLEELNLYIDLSNPAHYWDDETEGCVTVDFQYLNSLHNAKKFMLKINSNRLCEQIETETIKDLAKSTLDLTPNLEVLHLNLNSGEYNQVYLQKMEKLQRKEKLKCDMPFKNLSDISLPLKNAEQVFKLSQTIRKLTISAFTRDLKKYMPQLQKLLNKHAETLEYLRINYFICDVQDLDMGRKIDFPNLPKLQALEFHVSRHPLSCSPSLKKMQETVAKGGVEKFNFIKLFMMGGNRFKEKFPSLQSFTCEVNIEGFNPMIYERILPWPNLDAESLNLCFPQFKSLKLSEPPNHENFYCSKETFDEWMIWFGKLFPNVKNIRFSKASFARQ